MRLVQISLTVVLSSLAFSTTAAPNSLAEATALFDQMDQEEMLEVLDNASLCISNRDFNCAHENLALAEELINTDADQKIWALVFEDYNSERNYVKAEAEAKRQAEEMQRREEREQEEAIERQEERLQRKRDEAYAMGSVFIGLQTHLSPEQRNQMLEAYVADTMAGEGANNIYAAGNQISSDLQQQLYEKEQRLKDEHAEQQRQRAEKTRLAIERQRATRAEAARERSAVHPQTAHAEQKYQQQLEQTQSAADVEGQARQVAEKKQRLEEQHARLQADTLRQEQAAQSETRQQPAITLRSTLSPVKIVEPTRQEIREDITESNPYEEYPDGVMGWGHAIAPWMGSGDGSGATRAQACATAKARQTAKLSEEEGRGFVTVTSRTDCICGTANNHYSWTCVTYYQAADTGKKRPVIAR